VSLLNQDEQSFAVNMTTSLFSGAQVWTGLSDKVKFGTWVWNDGSATGFLNWKSGSPKSHLSEHCVVMDEDGEWDDLDCELSRAFICKRVQGECAWGNRVIGAPKPTISTELLRNSGVEEQISFRAVAEPSGSAGNIEIRIDMAQKTGGAVKYGIAFSQDALPNDSCPSEDVLNLDWWNVERTQCTSTLTLNLPLSEFISLTSPEMTSNDGSDIVTMSSQLFLYYYDSTSEGCTISRFSTSVSVRTILMAESELDFLFEGGSIVKDINAASISTDNGRFIAQILLLPAHPRFRFDDFHFLSHTKGIDFTLDSMPINCDDDAEDNSECQYLLTIVSSTTEPDYSGDLKLSFHFYWSPHNVTHTSITFKVRYGVIEDPPVLGNVINTETSLVEPGDFSQTTDVFVRFERAFIRTQTVEALDVPNMEFYFSQVWLCCTKDRQILPPYNPSEGAMGCTAYNPNTMSVWERLITNGQTNSDLNVQIEDLGPLVNNLAVLSFDPMNLNGEDKLCYIHSRVRIKLDVDDLLPAREIQTVESDSTQAVSFKSCSIYNNDPEECYAQDTCQYNDGTQTCYNYEDNGAGNQRVSAIAVILILGVLLFMQ